MIKITALFWIALLAVAGGTVMRVSYQVRHVQEHLSQIGRDIHREQDALRILTAEWNTLNDPQRIDALAKRYLPLKPTPIQRVVALDDIPLKPSADQLARIALAKATGKTATQTTAPVQKATGAIREAKAAAGPPRPVTHAALPAPTAPLTTPSVGFLRIRAERPE